MKTDPHTRHISSQEVNFHSLSFSDYNGRLFQWQGELYRAIPSDQAPLYRELFNLGAIQTLVDEKLLVDTQLTDLKLESYDTILQHRRIPFISYPQEWCDAMLKDAALLHLDFCLALDRYDLTTDDAHPVNILFDGCQPCFVDFGSINRLPKNIWYPWPWPPYAQFCQVFLYPLLLKAHGYGRIARWLMHDFEKGTLKSDVDALIRRPLSPLRLAEVGNRLRQYHGQPFTHGPLLLRPVIQKGYVLAGQLLTWLSGIKPSRHDFLQQIRAEVANIHLTSEPSTSINSRVGDSTQQGETPKNYQLVQQVLSDLRPCSVLDINSGDSNGNYALLASGCGSQVVAIDGQEAHVRKLYYRTKATNHRILPLWLNFASPSYGLANDFLAPAHQRLQCDLVLALTIDPKLMLKRGFGFIVDRLAVFSKRWLLIEFTPQVDPILETRWMERTISCPWYTLENFTTALKTRFNRIDILPSCPQPRVLLLCEK